MRSAYGRLVAALREQADLAAALHLLGWDQETGMPAGALAGRARQIGTVAALLHERRTAPAFMDLVDELADRAGELGPDETVDVRETKWRLDRRRALDAALVRERAALHAEARGVWIAARQSSDFAMLAPYLERIFDIERRVAITIDAGADPYQTLLEEHEPGARLDAVAVLFDELLAGTAPLVERLRARLEARPIEASVLRGDFALDTQRAFNRYVAGCLGFDFRRGRLDEAAHPFAITVGDEVRITTRYDPSDLRYALFSTVHEVGHGLYEQGLDDAAWGTPRGMSCSLGIHESQSRLWENLVARSEAFWRFLLPAVRRSFPMVQAGLDAVLVAVNDARPSLIRTEADELTYNLHVILRFELERALIAGDLRVRDLPAAWAAKMRRFLGIEPESDREGVLQDVHWASGAVGYFPTYALGNVYAAQLAQAAAAELGSLEAACAAGDFSPLLGWLRERVHRAGQRHRASALIESVTGTVPSAAPLLAHLEKKTAFLESA